MSTLKPPRPVLDFTHQDQTARQHRVETDRQRTVSSQRSVLNLSPPRRAEWWRDRSRSSGERIEAFPAPKLLFAEPVRSCCSKLAHRSRYPRPRRCSPQLSNDSATRIAGKARKPKLHAVAEARRISRARQRGWACLPCSRCQSSVKSRRFSRSEKRRRISFTLAACALTMLIRACRFSASISSLSKSLSVGCGSAQAAQQPASRHWTGELRGCRGGNFPREEARWWAELWRTE